MDDVCWKILKHEELTNSYKKQIVMLKDQHWKYGMQSQLNWIDKNIQLGDLHIVGERWNNKSHCICAYLNLVRVNVRFDEKNYEYIGIGNVCIDKKYEHRGYGIKLLNQVNTYLIETGKQGILLCKDSLVPFYKKCGWEMILPKQIRIGSDEYNNKIMVFPMIEQTIERIEIERNF